MRLTNAMASGKSRKVHSRTSLPSFSDHSGSARNRSSTSDGVSVFFMRFPRGFDATAGSARLAIAEVAGGNFSICLKEKSCRTANVQLAREVALRQQERGGRM